MAWAAVPELSVVSSDGDGGGSVLLTAPPSRYALELMAQPVQLLERQRQGAPAAALTCRPRQYLFNTAEGLQRQATERGLQLDGVGSVLFTRLRDGAAGGLSGLIYSLLERGAPRLEVYGPKGSAAMVSSMQQAYLRRGPELATAEFSGALGECWQDEDVVVVPAVLTGRGASAAGAEAGGVNPGCPFCTGRIAVPQQSGDGGEQPAADEPRPAKRQRQDPVAPAAGARESLCYVCYIPATGDGRPEREAGEADDGAGRQGGSVLDDSASSTSSDSGDEAEGHGHASWALVVVDVSSAALVWELDGHPSLACLRARRHPGCISALTVLHLSPSRVQRSEEYLRWMEALGPCPLPKSLDANHAPGLTCWWLQAQM